MDLSFNEYRRHVLTAQAVSQGVKSKAQKHTATPTAIKVVRSLHLDAAVTNVAVLGKVLYFLTFTLWTHARFYRPCFDAALLTLNTS